MEPSLAGPTGPRRPWAVLADDAAALLCLASTRSWTAPEGAAGRVRSFRWRESPSRPSYPRCGSYRPIEDLLSAPGLRSPPDGDGEIPVAWRTTQSSIGKYVLGGGTGDDNTTGGAPAEKSSASAPPREGWCGRGRAVRVASVSPPPMSQPFAQPQLVESALSEVPAAAPGFPTASPPPATSPVRPVVTEPPPVTPALTSTSVRASASSLS